MKKLTDRQVQSTIQLSLYTLMMFMVALPVYAQEDGPGIAAARNFVGLLNDIILFPLITLMLAIALLVFLWGCFDYIRGASNPTAREAGAKHITYGIMGLVVMVSAWAILSLVAGTFDLTIPT